MMIAVDTNILVYALRQDADFHPRALAAMASLTSSGNRWGLPWPCLHEFLAIATHPRIYAPPTPLQIAIEALDVWLTAPGCTLLGEGPGYWERLQALLEKSKAIGPMVHDARIAALCLQHGVRELWTADRDFSRYGELRTRNPLAEA
jgi:hypothetical protein